MKFSRATDSALAHRLEQIERLTRQDVGCCSRRVTGYNETSADESLGESARQNGDQQKTTDQSGLRLRRRLLQSPTIAAALISLPSPVCV